MLFVRRAKHMNHTSIRSCNWHQKMHPGFGTSMGNAWRNVEVYKTSEKVPFFIIALFRYFFRLQKSGKSCIYFHQTLAESGTSGQGLVKNSIRNMEIKRATPEHMFATLAHARVAIYTCSRLENFLPP